MGKMKFYVRKYWEYMIKLSMKTILFFPPWIIKSHILFICCYTPYITIIQLNIYKISFSQTSWLHIFSFVAPLWLTGKCYWLGRNGSSSRLESSDWNITIWLTRVPTLVCEFSWKCCHMIFKVSECDLLCQNPSPNKKNVKYSWWVWFLMGTLLFSQVPNLVCY
jgi:hypothetical protein